MKKLIRAILPKRITEYISNKRIDNYKKRLNLELSDSLDKVKYSSGKDGRIILIGTATYGNVGDHAISEAEIKFFSENFKNNEIIEIPVIIFNNNIQFYRRYITAKDLLIINGGGFLGDLWESGEKLIDNVLNFFQNNHIIVFPQTVYYKKNSINKINNHIELISKNPNISVIVRDKSSYNFINNHNFPLKNLILTPDIVTYIEGNKYHKANGKIYFILRRDHEKTSSEYTINRFKKVFLDLDYKEEDIIITDSVVNGNYDFRNRQILIENFLDEIGNADFIVSDRLHGMLLSAICGIPVIALDNISRKVYGAYEWLSELPYVLYYEDKKIESKIENILSKKSNFKYDPKIFKEYHNNIIDIVQNELELININFNKSE